MEYWRAVIAEALPLNYIVPLILVLTTLYFAGDFVHTAMVGTGEVIEETVETVSHDSIFGWEDVPDTPVVAEVSHAVGLETDRVKLN